MNDSNFEKFKQTWEAEIEKIGKEVIDNRGSWRIYERYRFEWLHLTSGMRRSQYTVEVSRDLYLLESKLIIALEIARTKYKLQSHSLIVRFFESVADIFRGVPKPKVDDLGFKK